MDHNQSMDTNEGFKMTELGQLPEEWGVVRFEAVEIKVC